jgi:hypothetical protein
MWCIGMSRLSVANHVSQGSAKLVDGWYSSILYTAAGINSVDSVNRFI